LIVDFIIDEANWEFQVLNTIKKIADCGAVGLLVVKENLEASVKAMVNPENIRALSFLNELEIIRLVPEAVDEVTSTKLLHVANSFSSMNAKNLRLAQPDGNRFYSNILWTPKKD